MFTGAVVEQFKREGGAITAKGTSRNSNGFRLVLRSLCRPVIMPYGAIARSDRDGAPVHASGFVATFRSEIEHIVSAHHYLDAAPISGVGPEDLARIVFVKALTPGHSSPISLHSPKL